MKKDDTNNGDRLLAYFKKAGKDKKAKKSAPPLFLLWRFVASREFQERLADVQKEIKEKRLIRNNGARR